MEFNYNSNEALKKNYEKISNELSKIGAVFYSHGWVMGTSGNLSAVVSEDPLILAITGSGLDKGYLEQNQIILIDQNENVLHGKYKPSAETALHITLVKEISCRAVFHIHSPWSTVLSKIHEKNGGLWIEGYEMLKALDGIKTHEHREWLPILQTSQDMDALSQELKEVLRNSPRAHGFMLSGHGLYAWGKSTQEAKRHVEGLEFLLEVLGRTESLNTR